MANAEYTVTFDEAKIADLSRRVAAALRAEETPIYDALAAEYDARIIAEQVEARLAEIEETIPDPPEDDIMDIASWNEARYAAFCIMARSFRKVMPSLQEGWGADFSAYASGVLDTLYTLSSLPSGEEINAQMEARRRKKEEENEH